MADNNDEEQNGAGVPPFEQGQPQQPDPLVPPQPIHYTTPHEPPPHGGIPYNSNNAGQQKSKNAIVSLILGIIAFLFSFGCTCCGLRGGLGAVIGVAGLVFGILANSEIKKSYESRTGKELANVGIVLSILGIIIGIIMTVLSASSVFQVS